MTVCAAVLAYVQQAMIACERGPGVALVAVGGLVVDDCCAGNLIVAPERIFRTTDPFPAEAGPDSICRDSPIGIDVVVRVDRCVPVIDDRGKAPSIAAQEAAYAAVMTDAAIVWGAIVSDGFLGDDGYGDPLWERATVGQLFAGPDGGCIGVETRLTIGIPYGLWCPPGCVA